VAGVQVWAERRCDGGVDAFPFFAIGEWTMKPDPAVPLVGSWVLTTSQAPGVSCGGTFDNNVELVGEADVVVVCGGGQGGRPSPIVVVTVVC
jgi:hypothetical protein